MAVIVTPSSTAATLAANAATATFPIVFEIGADPVTSLLHFDCCQDAKGTCACRWRLSDMLTGFQTQQAPEPTVPKPVPYPPPMPEPPQPNPQRVPSDTELSNAAILSISGMVGILGLVVYFLASPLTPVQRIASGHAAISEVVTR